MKWSQRYSFRAFLKNSPEASSDPPRRYVPLPWVYLGDLEDPTKTERPLVDPGTRPVFRSSPFNDFLFSLSIFCSFEWLATSMTIETASGRPQQFCRKGIRSAFFPFLSFSAYLRDRIPFSFAFLRFLGVEFHTDKKRRRFGYTHRTPLANAGRQACMHGVGRMTITIK
jgi:hypothetical protein